MKMLRESILIDGFAFFTFSYRFSKKKLLISKNGESLFITKNDYKKIISKTFGESLKERWDTYLNRCQETKKVVAPIFFIVELTNDCNLACRYCFRGEHKKSEISEETLKEVVSQISTYIKENEITDFSVQPWGGEPLLRIDLIVLMRKLFLEKGLYPTISVETNGLLLNQKNLKTLFDNNIHFGISIDGKNCVNDFHRPFPNGESSTGFVEKNILNIKNKYPHLNLSSISVNDSLSLPNLSDSLEYLTKELKINNIKMNLVKNNPYLGSDIKPLNENEISLFYKTLFDFLKKHPNVSEGNVSERACNLLTNKAQNICLSRGCQGGYKMIAYDVNGDIYNCELIGNEEQKIGSIKSDIVTSIQKSIDTGNRYFALKQKEECKTCPWWGFCRGGCSSNCLNNNTDVDETNCIINKTLYPLIVEAIFKNEHFVIKYAGRNKK